MHLNDEQIQRYLHGELSARERAEVATHLESCELCTGRVAEGEREEREVFDLLERLDHRPPHRDINTVMPTNREYGRPARNAWIRRAAVVVLIVVLGGAAYAIPGSPVPGWFKKLGGLVGGDQAPVEEANEPVDTVDTTTLVPSVSGIAIPPSKRFAIVMAAPQDSGTVYLTPTDGFNVTIRALGGAPRFTLTSSDRLDVDNTGLNSSYEIEVPVSANFVELVVGERRIILKDSRRFGEDLRIDEKGRRLIPLTQ